MKCAKCGAEYEKAPNFCTSCGARMEDKPSESYRKPVTRAQVFFFVLLAYILIPYALEIGGGYLENLIGDILFAGIVIVFFALDYKNYLKVFRQPVNNYLLLSLLPLGLICFAFVVNIVSSWVNDALFHRTAGNYIWGYWDAPNPLLFCIISVGIFPAIFEELAFRVIMFEELSKIMSKNATIIITAILFTVLHISFISLIWILPAGLLFGYLRARYATPVYGMIGHFVYNTTIVLIEYLT